MLDTNISGIPVLLCRYVYIILSGEGVAIWISLSQKRLVAIIYFLTCMYSLTWRHACIRRVISCSLLVDMGDW